MSQRWRAIWMPLLVGLLVWPAHAVRLQYKGKAGDRVVFSVSTTMSNKMEMGGQTQAMPMKMTMRLVTEVVKADTKTIVLRYQIDKPSAEANGQPVPLPVAQFPTMLVTMERSGKVIKVQQEGQPKPPVGGPGAMQPGGMGDISQSFIYFPDRDLKPGDSWTNTTSLPTPGSGKMEMQTKNTFLQMATVDGIKCAKIRTDFTVPISMSNPGQPGPGGTGSIKGSVKGTTITFFDLAAGQVHKSETTAKTQMSMTGMAPPGQGQGQRMSMKMSSDVRSTMQRLKGAR